MTSAKTAVTGAARKVRSSRAVRALARGGYAANGVVHVLIGILVLALAFGSTGDADQTGALRAIAAAPMGLAGLWTIAMLLGALALYHLIEGLLVRDESPAKTWGRRISAWGQAVVFAALASVAISVALGARPDGNATAEGASRSVLTIPGGPFLLGAVGLGIAGGGVAFVVMGFLRSFEKKMSIPSGAVGPFVKGLGIVGYIAKGVSLVIVGILLVVAAVTADPAEAGGLDDAFDSVHALFLGPLLVGLVGAGFVAYGVFLFFRARYARL